MIKANVTAQDVADFMNELSVLDTQAVTALSKVKVTCNKELAEHPDVQLKYKKWKDNEIGFISILNALFAIHDGSMDVRRVTPQDVVDFMNRLIEIDPEAIAKLVEEKVTCNDALASHSTVQVQLYNENEDASGEPEPRVGIVGILNGIFGVFEDGPNKDFGTIAYKIDDSTNNIEFMVVSPDTPLHEQD